LFCLALYEFELICHVVLSPSACCSPVFWLTALVGAPAIALLPDITVMLFRRYLRPDLVTLLQVGCVKQQLMCEDGSGSPSG
jgi:hypothetical protein